MVQTRAGSRAASEALETPTRETAAPPAPSSLPAARLSTTTDTPTKTKATRTPRRSALASAPFTPTLDSPRESRAEGTHRVAVPRTPSAQGASARRRARQKDRIRALKACPEVLEGELGEEGEAVKEVLERLLDENSEGVSIARVAAAVGGDDWEGSIPLVRGVVLAGVRDGRWVLDPTQTRVAWL